MNNNLLKDKYPEIFSEIDVEKTLEIFPNIDLDSLTASSAKKIFWKCKNGHSYQATVNKREYGRGCPYCANQKVLSGFNDLETYIKSHPEYRYLLNEWSADNIITSKDISYVSTKNINWVCLKCGNIYSQTVKNRINNYSCPYCCNPARRLLTGFNDLQTKYPEIAKDWDYAKNYPILPSQVLPGSNKKYWFICDKGHHYLQSIYSKRLYGCPYCKNKKILSGYNDLETYCNSHPEYVHILDEWDYSKNKLKPNQIFPHSTEYVWFICKNNHGYKTQLYHRLNNCGCPHCSHKKSIPELTLFEICKKYIDNHAESGKKINCKEIDIFLPLLNICIEYDGLYFHLSSDVLTRDSAKNISILEDSHNYTFIRIKETDNPDNLKKFKEISDNGLIIYYISNIYKDAYFQRLSEIIEEIFSINISTYIIKKFYKSVKLQRG